MYNLNIYSYSILETKLWVFESFVIIIAIDILMVDCIEKCEDIQSTFVTSGGCGCVNERIA